MGQVKTAYDVARTVGTVGQVDVQPGAVNVIPGSVRFSVDVRAGRDSHRLAAVADMGVRPPSELGRLAHEPAIGRGADSHGKEAAIPQAGADFLEQLCLVADGAIGNENHLAQDRALPVLIGIEFAEEDDRDGQVVHHVGTVALADPGRRRLLGALYYLPRRRRARR